MSQPVITDVNAEGFDASNLDDKTLATLKADSTTKIEPEPPAAPPTPPAVPVPPKEGEQPPPVVPPATPPAVPPATPPATPKEPETLLAGKYKTVDELAKGLSEIAKNLKYNPAFIERMITLAKKTGDTAALEQTYHDLYGAQARKETAAEPPAPPAPAEEPTLTPEAAQQRQAAEFTAAFDLSLEEFSRSAVAAEMTEKGYTFPKTREELAVIKAADPYLAMEINQEFQRIFRDVQGSIKSFIAADAGAKPHNDGLIESAKKEIAEAAHQYGLTNVDDAKIQEIIAAALKTDFPFEDRSGVKYLRDKGILKYFYAEQFPALAESIRLKSETNGRTQHLEDLKTMKNKGLESLVQSSTPGSKPVTAPKKIDINSEDDLRGLSIEELTKLRNEGISSA